MENNVANGNNQQTSRFANCGVLLTGSKTIPPPSIATETRRHSAAAIEFAKANPGFGAEENDWLGAEAYVDPLC